jgi:hypothetical protein
MRHDMLHENEPVAANEFVAHISMRAHQPVPRLAQGIEHRAHVAEQLLVYANRVLVQTRHRIDCHRIFRIERLVGNVLTVHGVAEHHILSRMQDVGVPEGVDGVADRVLAGRIQQRNGVVLLQRQDALAQIAVRDKLCIRPRSRRTFFMTGAKSSSSIRASRSTWNGSSGILMVSMSFKVTPSSHSIERLIKAYVSGPILSILQTSRRILLK